MSERTNQQSRVFDFDVESRATDDAIPVVVSTDAVVEVSDGPEVLVHTTEAIDLQRAPLPIIATHRGGQVNVGIVDNLQIVRGQLRGMARFGTRQEAAEYKADVLNRIIRSVSVGYARIRAKPRADGVLVTDRWMPTHTALVAEPADVGAGFYRERGALPAFELQAPDAPQVSQPAATAASLERTVMDDSNQAAAGAIADQGTQTRAAMPAQPRQGPSAMDLERNRKRGIENLCKANKIDDSIRDHWIGSGMSIDQITDDLLNIIEERGRTNPQNVTKLGLTAAETQRFSLFRAITATAEKNWTQAGFELECSREIAKRLGRNNVDPNRFFVPLEVQERAMPMRRDLTAGTGSAGGHLVATENMSFIDVLRNRSVAYRMGARRLSGLEGNVAIPRQTGAATAVWLANEASTITESQQTFGQLLLSPKHVGAYTEVSRQLMMQSSPAAEAIVTADLGAVCATAYDAAVIAGSGTGGQPTGITATAGIGAVTGTTLGYPGILDFQTDVAAANVMPVSGGYVTTPAVAALLMARVKFSGTASPLWEGNVWDGQVAGFPAMTSLQMAAASALFGDWAQVIVAEWGTLEIEVNPYANFQAAITGIRAIVSMDCGLRYAGAFSLATTIT
jgi:HK97 family phage major capsid protein